MIRTFISPLNEYYVDSFRRGFSVHSTFDKFSIIIDDHALERYDERIGALPSYLKCLDSRKLMNVAMTKCMKHITKIASLPVTTQFKAKKGVFRFVIPMDVTNSKEEVLYTRNIELSLMYSISRPQFVDKDLENELINMRLNHDSVIDRDEFIRDNCDKYFKPFTRTGLITDDKVIVVIETVVVASSSKDTFPVSFSVVYKHLKDEKIVSKNKVTITESEMKRLEKLFDKHGISYVYDKSKQDKLKSKGSKYGGKLSNKGSK